MTSNESDGNWTQTAVHVLSNSLIVIVCCQSFQGFGPVLKGTIFFLFLRLNKKYYIYFFWWTPQTTEQHCCCCSHEVWRCTCAAHRQRSKGWDVPTGSGRGSVWEAGPGESWTADELGGPVCRVRLLELPLFSSQSKSWFMVVVLEWAACWEKVWHMLVGLQHFLH